MNAQLPLSRCAAALAELRCFAEFGRLSGQRRIHMPRENSASATASPTAPSAAEQDAWWRLVNAPNLKLIERVRRYLKQKLACQMFLYEAEQAIGCGQMNMARFPDVVVSKSSYGCMTDTDAEEKRWG